MQPRGERPPGTEVQRPDRRTTAARLAGVEAGPSGRARQRPAIRRRAPRPRPRRGGARGRHPAEQRPRRGRPLAAAVPTAPGLARTVATSSSPSNAPASSTYGKVAFLGLNSTTIAAPLEFLADFPVRTRRFRTRTPSRRAPSVRMPAGRRRSSTAPTASGGPSATAETSRRRRSTRTSGPTRGMSVPGRRCRGQTQTVSSLGQHAIVNGMDTATLNAFSTAGARSIAVEPTPTATGRRE